MMGQGLGPGLATMATRRSVILSADGLELVLTLRGAACSAAASRDRSAPPMIPAEVLNRSRRPILLLLLSISLFSSLCYRPLPDGRGSVTRLHPGGCGSMFGGGRARPAHLGNYQ